MGIDETTDAHAGPDEADSAGAAVDAAVADTAVPQDTVRALERMLTWSRRLKPPGGLSASTYATLDTLSYSGPMRTTVLAQREGITQPGMTALINRLESEGLAFRTPDPTDGRASLIAITEVGTSVLAARRAERAALLATRIGLLDPADQAALHAALPAFDRLTADLDAGPATS